MPKLNCWEVMKCGREPGGENVAELGACPAAISEKTRGTNCGENGGRACWAIAGTYCNDEVQGTFALKLHSCKKCKFYVKVKEEEGINWENAKVIIKRLKD